MKKVDLEFKIRDLEEKLIKISKGEKIDSNVKTTEKKKEEKISNQQSSKVIIINPGKKDYKRRFGMFSSCRIKERNIICCFLF